MSPTRRVTPRTIFRFKFELFPILDANYPVHKEIGSASDKNTSVPFLIHWLVRLFSGWVLLLPKVVLNGDRVYGHRDVLGGRYLAETLATRVVPAIHNEMTTEQRGSLLQGIGAGKREHADNPDVQLPFDFFLLLPFFPKLQREVFRYEQMSHL